MRPIRGFAANSASAHRPTPYCQPQTSDDTPQHAIDVAMVQAALASLERKIRLHYAQGRPHAEIVKLHDIRYTWRSLARDLGRRCWTVMSPRARSGIERYLGPEECERIRRLHWRDETPEVLRDLPKKPPGRTT